MADVTVNIEMVDKMSRDIDGLRRKVGRFESELDNTEKQSKKTKRGLSELGRTAQFAVAAGFAAATAAAVAFAKKSIAAASSVEEMRSKFDVVFGREAPRVVETLEEFGDRVNRSRFELMEMASTLQDTFVPLGFTRKAAADLSVELSKLAVDVGSFNNAADADVVRDFQSAIVGNHETVRKYGIVITEAGLKQEAYRSGIADLGAELTSAQKVQARLNLITAGTADAQGDAERTADSFANASRGLEASIKDLEVAIGKGLIPTLQQAMPWLQELIDNTTEAVQEGNEMRSAMEAMGAELREGAGPAMVFLADGTRVTTREFLEMARASRESGNMLRAIKSTGVAAGEGIDAAGDAAEDAGRKAQGATRAFQSFFDGLDTQIGSKIQSTLEQIDFEAAGGRQLTEAFGNVQQAVDEGKIRPEQGREMLEGLFVAEQELQLELGNITAFEAARNIEQELGGTLSEALQMVQDIQRGIGGLSSKTIDIRVNLITEGRIPGMGGFDPPGFQHGGQFIVPPGFPNDTFPMRVSSGERVIVEPRQNITQNFNAAPGGGNRDLLDTIKREVRRL